MFNPSVNWYEMKGNDIKMDLPLDFLSLLVDLSAIGLPRITNMALLKSRVLGSVARRGFFRESNAAMESAGETSEPLANLTKDNTKFDQKAGKIEGEGKKLMAEKVDCNERICEIKSWKNSKNSSGSSLFFD